MFVILGMDIVTPQYRFLFIGYDSSTVCNHIH